MTTADNQYREKSLWLDGVPGSLAPRPALAQDINCDVAIVGAGFTGLWSAYYLRRADPTLRVVVIERDIAGFGASGRNGGWASGGIAGSAEIYRRRHGADSVRRALKETYRSVDEIGRVVYAENIECGYVKGGELMAATTGPQRARLEDTVRALRDQGASEEDIQLLDPGEAAQHARVGGCLVASFTPHCARIDPGRLVRGLAAVCERIGVTIFERSAALEVSRRRVRTTGGTVRSPVVLRATESYTPGRRFLPLYSLMIATEPLTTEVWGELAWRDGLVISDYRHLFFYAQRTPDGRIAIGGRGAPYSLRQPISPDHERSPGVRARLERALQTHFRAASGAKVTHHWGGSLGVPRDWCMSISFDPKTGYGWAGGYSGHGVVASNIAGRTLADLVLGTHSDLTTLPWVGHRSRLWEPEPIRWAASRAIIATLGSADRYEDRTGRTALRTRFIEPFMPPD